MLLTVFNGKEMFGFWQSIHQTFFLAPFLKLLIYALCKRGAGKKNQ